jgi:hypothetical protein
MTMNAVKVYCSFACPMMSAEEAVRAVRLPQIEIAVKKVAMKYIAAFGVANRLKLRGNEFAFDYKSVFRKSAGRWIELDLQSLRTKTLRIVDVIKREKGVAAYRSAKMQVFEAIRRRHLTGIEFFPGKGLLWHLNERVGYAGGSSLNQRVIVSFLAQHCTFSRDLDFERRIIQTAKNVQRNRNRVT